MTRKDLSELNVNEGTVSDCEIGFAVYQKKPEFGPASIKMNNLKISKTNVLYWLEKGSVLNLEGKLLEPNQNKVKELLY